MIKELEATSPRKIFDWLVLFSVFFVTGFYWPNHEIIQMKYLCWEMFVSFLTSAYFIWGGIRKINDWVPAVFLVYCILNMFSHMTGGNTKFAMMTVFFTVLGYYLISNGVSLDGVQKIKKGIVIYAILNVISYFIESMHINSPFTLEGSGHRPSGFMVYPAHFSLLCAIALFFAWEWKKWLCLPMVAGIIASNEISAYLGLFICFVYGFKGKWWTWAGLLIVVAFIFEFKGLQGHIHTAWHIRSQFWIPIWEISWQRALDGFGIGSYSGLANKIFPQFPPNTWLELHNELLQGFFEGGLIMIGIIGLWFWELKRKIVGAYYERPFIYSFIVILSISCAHSVLHFPDCMWLIVILFACFQIEYHEANLKWSIEND